MSALVVGVPLGGPPDAALLLLGPSLGTSATTLWSVAAVPLAKHLRVVGWDLPGHGHHRGDVGGFTIEELAADVIRLADELAPGQEFHYAGDSLGGCVGLQLLLDHPDRVRTATLLCTGARIGNEDGWRDRAATVRASGIGSVVEGSTQRWFAPGFLDREPTVASALLHALQATDPEGYALTCEALASFDVTDRLSDITAPVLAIAGGHDRPTPPESLAEIVRGVPEARFVVLDDVAHLAPAEAPHEVARLVLDHTGATS